MLPAILLLLSHRCAFFGMETNRHISPNLQIPGQEDWTPRNGHCYPGNPQYIEHMSTGYNYPNYCYPYTPPPLPPHFASYGLVYMGVQPMYMPMMGVSYFAPPLHDQYGDQYYEHNPDDVMSRVSRKPRIARRRVPEHAEVVEPQPRSTPAAAAVRTGKQENMAPVASARQGMPSKDLMFLLAKQLSPSGVSSLGRIVLPKKEAEAHLPHLVASEGVLLTMADFDTRQNWTFRYRFWSNNKSRMYLLENTRDFVKVHNLQERDMLVLYKDTDGSYVVRAEKRSTLINGQACNGAAGDMMAADEVPSTEEETSRQKQTFEFLI